MGHPTQRITEADVSKSNEDGQTVVETEHPPKDPQVVGTNHSRDYRIPDGRIVSGSPERRAQINIEVLKLLKQLQAEERAPTIDEQHVLAGYVGWGGAKQLFTEKPEWAAAQAEVKSLMTDEEFEDARTSTMNAHYTSDQVVDAMWNALRRLGVKPGMSFFEPAIGVGNFFGRQPEDLLNGSRRIGLDKDTITARIAQHLYPDSGVDISAFEKADLPKDYFDFAVSNIPFGKYGVFDPAFRAKSYLTSPIHNYFFAKALTHVRPGGVVAFITSRYTMDAYDKPAVSLRRYISSKADFLGAVRLPAGAFKTAANTDVITDIIFLRRRPDGAEPKDHQAWETTGNRTFNSTIHGRISHAQNQYYIAHPEMVLGTEGVKSSQFSPTDYNVEGRLTDENLKEALDRLPADAIQPWAGKAQTRRSIAMRDIKGGADDKVGAFFFDDKGNLFRKKSRGEATPEDASDLVKSRIRGQLALRDAFVRLTDAERAGAPEADLARQRKLLNDLYDAFVAAHGFLTSPANIKAMVGDPDAPLLPGLERNYSKGKKAEGVKESADKAPIFAKRILGVTEAPTPANAKEALSVVLNSRGYLDWDHLKELTGLPDDALENELAGVVYVNPETGLHESADEYLSGSVRAKLRAAIAHAKLDAKYKPNVKALEAVQPEDVPPSRIRAMLGVTWVPLETYGEFVKDTLNLKYTPRVAHFGNEWSIGVEDRHPTTKWDTRRVRAGKLIEAALNLRRIKVYDQGTDGPEVNPVETLAAAERQREINEYFNEWLFRDTSRGDALVRIYNDLQNDLRLRVFDGSHLTLPGMSRASLRGGQLEPYQMAAVWRQIAQRNVLLNHAPGAGKTYEMIAAGMELKRLGLIQRPMYVVPNSTLGGWQDQFASLYPQARVLVFSETDLKKDKRRAAIARMATGDWDAVVIPHSSFQFIPVGDEIFQQHYDELEQELTQAIMDAEEAGLDTRMVTRLERAKENLLTGLQKRRNAAKQDQLITWEQLGIDQMFVDESHEFKKLGFRTKQPNIAGIDPGGNQKTFDLRMKTRYTQTHGRGVVFASGTPVTNTMGEIHSIMRYLIEPELRARGIEKFDDWSAEFGRTVGNFERKPEGGGYQMKERYSKFVNLPRLATLLRTFTDVMTSDMLQIPRPAIAGGARRAVVTLMTPEQEAFQQKLQSRASDIRRDPRKALPDGMLVVYGDGSKMAMDIRLVDAHGSDDPEGRLSKIAENVYRLWKESTPVKGTQLIFSDIGVPKTGKRGSKKSRQNTDILAHILNLSSKDAPASGPGAKTDFSVYDELIKKLVDLGIPPNEISHMGIPKNKQERKEIFRRLDQGDLRVLIGSSQKMGIGVNVQTRGYALHHADGSPARPDILDQREARFIRQGNQNPEVHLIYYTTKGTLDESKFGMVVRKGKFINNLWKGDFTQEEAEDISEGVPSWEMFQAMTSGDPRILRKLEVDSEVDRLSRLQWAFNDQMYGFRRSLAYAAEEIERATDRLKYLNKAKEARDKTGRVWIINGAKFEGDGIGEEVGKALVAASQGVAHTTKRLGTAHGLELELRFTQYGKEFIPHIAIASGPVQIADQDLMGWTMSPELLEQNIAFNKTKPEYAQMRPEENLKPASLTTRLENDVKRIDAHLDVMQEVKAKNEAEVANISKDTDQKWPYQAEYDKLVAEQQQLLKDLGLLKDDAAVNAMDNGEEIVDAGVAAEEPETEDDEDEGDGEGDQDLPSFSRRSPGEDAGPVWFSQLEKTVESKMPAKASPAQVAAIVGNPQSGVKADELKWTGLRDWLSEQKGMLTKPQVLDYLRTNGVQVNEVLHSDAHNQRYVALSHRAQQLSNEWYETNQRIGLPSEKPEDRGRLAEIEREQHEADRLLREHGKTDGSPKFKKYTTPGGREYGELLLTLPETTPLKPDVTAIGPVVRRLRELLSGEDYLGFDNAIQALAAIRDHQDWQERWDVRNNPELQELGDKYRVMVQDHKNFEREAQPYKSSHWGEPNVVAHIRFTTRTAPNKKRTLHLEEIQSDWHQQGRDKGYRESGASAAQLIEDLKQAEKDAHRDARRLQDAVAKRLSLREMEYRAAHLLSIDLTHRHEGLGFFAPARALEAVRNYPDTWASKFGVTDSHTISSADEYLKANREVQATDAEIQAANDAVYAGKQNIESLLRRKNSGVPDAPFQKTWHELAFRRALRWAAENGFDRISWTTGAQQAGRYDLSKQVSKVTFLPEGSRGVIEAFDKSGASILNKAIDVNDLPDYVGKDVARKLLETPKPNGEHVLEGDNLQVGGHGMNEFYDQILTRYAAKLGKQWGAKVEESEIQTGKQKTDRTHVYEGPNFTMEQWVEAVEKATADHPGHMFTTNYDEQWVNGAGASQIARALGGRVVLRETTKAASTETVHSMDITPAMRKSVMAGQPLFVKGWDAIENAPGDNPNSTGAPKAIYKNGVILANQPAVSAIGDTWGNHDIGGVHLEQRHIGKVIEHLRKDPANAAVADLLEAHKNEDLAVASSAGSLTAAKRALRHERFHQAQAQLPGHLGPAEAQFMSRPEARTAAKGLAALGYKPKQYALEIGAHLAAGQFSKLGLSPAEGENLAFHYFATLREVHGNERVDNVVKRGIVPSIAKHAYRANTGRTGNDQEKHPGGNGSHEGGPGSVRRVVPEEIRPRDPDLQRGTPEEPGRRDAGVTLGSGLGSLQPAYDAAVRAGGQFAREEVLPKVAKVLNGTGQVAASLVNILAPRVGVPTKTLDTISRMNGGREAANFLLAAQLDKWSADINKMSRVQMVDFIDRQKTGQLQATPELDALSGFLRKMDDLLYDQISEYRPSLDYLENHYRVLWKVIPGSPEAKARMAGGKGAFRGAFRRPLQGSKGFLKQSKLSDMSEGLALGGVPYSYNPLIMFHAHYADAMKFITAQRLWERFGKMGVRKFVKFGHQPPADYVALNDPIARAYFPVPQGMVKAGDWYVEPGAARLLNNMLSRDYLREVHGDTPASRFSGNIGKSLLAIKNNTTAIELAMSPFHAVFEGLEAVGSQMGIGLRQMWNLGVRGGDIGQVAKGAATMALAPGAAVTAAKQGSMAKQVFANFEEMQKTVDGRQWLAANPSAMADIPYFFIGGGKMAMPEDFRIQAENSFRQYWNSARQGGNPGHYLSAAIRSVPAFNQAIMEPLFGKYIPNLKIGFFLREFALAKQEYADRLNSGEMTQEELARKVVDSVENRFGEMNFDNLYWNRTFKTAMQLLFRSVTWKLGNIRATSSAAYGQAGEFRRAAQNKELPLLDPSMAWLLGMSLFTAILGSVITMAATRKRPQQIKDVIYPVIDPTTGMRVSMPTYWRDYMHLAHSPFGYAKSSLAGDIGKAADIWENKDFYGNEVYNPDDPLYRKTLDSLAHFVPLPFNVSSALQAKKEGGSALARGAGFAGFTKAPKYIEQSKAEELASGYAARHRDVGSRTHFEAERAQAAAGIRNTYRRGGDPQQQLVEALHEGLITPKDANTYRKQASESALKASVKALSLPEALRVYDAATPNERRDIDREVRRKVFSPRVRPAEWGDRNSETAKLAKKYFNTGPLNSPQHIGTPSPIQ